MDIGYSVVEWNGSYGEAEKKRDVAHFETDTRFNDAEALEAAKKDAVARSLKDRTLTYRVSGVRGIVFTAHNGQGIDVEPR